MGEGRVNAYILLQHEWEEWEFGNWGVWGGKTKGQYAPYVKWGLGAYSKELNKNKEPVAYKESVVKGHRIKIVVYIF